MALFNGGILPFLKETNITLPEIIHMEVENCLLDMVIQGAHAIHFHDFRECRKLLESCEFAATPRGKRVLFASSSPVVPTPSLASGNSKSPVREHNSDVPVETQWVHVGSVVTDPPVLQISSGTGREFYKEGILSDQQMVGVQENPKVCKTPTSSGGSRYLIIGSSWYA